jgi:hypothetical protein
MKERQVSLTTRLAQELELLCVGKFRWGYIFNLSMKGLVSGQYLLSFYAGNDHSFFYTVKFEVK